MAAQSVVFGALSRSGVGSGVPTTGTAISSGDPSGHFQVASGVLCPSVAGDTADLNAGPYALTMNDGSAFNITIEANTWSCSTQAEWDFLIAQATATLAGKTIRVRRLPSNGVYTSGVDGVAARLRRADFSSAGVSLTIKGDDTSVIPDHEDDTGVTSFPIFDKFVLRGTRNVTFRHLDFDATTASKFSIIGEAANNAINLRIENCRIRGVPQDPNGNFTAGSGTGANQYPNLDMILTTGSAVNSVGPLFINNNHITWALRAILATVSLGEIQTRGNRIKYFYDDGINVVYGGANQLGTCEDNVVSHPLGKGTDAGNPHVDMIRFAASNTATTDWTVKINRNRLFHGNSRGDLQGILLSDFKSGGVDSGHFFIAEMIGNVLPYETTQALSIENAKDCVVLNNTFVSHNTDATGTAAIKVGAGSTDSTTSGTHRLERNIAEGYTLGGTPTLVDNITLGAGGATNSYASVFDGGTTDPDTLAVLMSTFNRKSGGPADLAGTPDAGAIGASAVTFATTIPGGDGANLVS